MAIFLTSISLVLFIYDFNFLGFLFLLLSFYNLFRIYRLGNFFTLFVNMPTYWQNITQTIEIGKFSDYKINIKDEKSIINFFKVFVILRLLFDLKVDKKVIDNFEEMYDVCMPGVSNLRKKALIYFARVQISRPEILPDIENAIMVRKRFGGSPKYVKQIPTKGFVCH